MKLSRMLALVLATTALGACSSPRYVTRIAGNAEQVKLVYFQNKFFGSETGIVKCDKGKYNYLENCRDLQVEFAD